MQYDFDKKETTFRFEKKLTDQELEKQTLLAQRQSQELSLKEQAVLLARKEKDLEHLGFLKVNVEKENQEKIKEYESRFGLETRPDTSTIAAPFESLKQCKSQSTHSQSSGVRASILVVRHSGVCHDRMGSPTSETSKTPY